MRNRSFVLVLGVVFLMGIIGINFIQSELNLSDSLTNQRHQNILKEFNKTNWVPVIVEVYSPEKIDNLISSLSEINFKNVKKETSTIFSVKVTKAGLDNLANNSNVKWIDLEESLSPANNNSAEPDNYPTRSEYNWLYWIIGIILISIIFWIIWRIKKKK